MPKKKNQRKKPKKPAAKKESIQQMQINAAKKILNTMHGSNTETAELLRTECLREYNRKLVEKGYGFSRSDLKKMNMFDIRAITEPTNDPTQIPKIKIETEMEDFIRKTDWLSIVPCFSEGVVQLNKDRYIYYKIEKIDAQNQNYTITLHDYIYRETTHWEVGVQGTLFVNFYEKENETTFSLMPLQNETYPYRRFNELYNLIPISEFDWNDAKKTEWKNIMTYAKMMQKQLIKARNNPIEDMFMIMAKAITAINFYLSQNKPSRPINQQRIKRKVEIKTEKITEKPISIRKVGTILIKSEKPPKPITKDSIIHYKTPSWKKRATIRTLRDGRKVYVRESVCYRKCLKNQNIDAGPVNIVLTKPKSKNNK